MNKEQTAIELLRKLYQCVDKTVPELAWMAGVLQNQEKCASTGLDELGKVLYDVENYLRVNYGTTISEEAHLLSEIDTLIKLIANTPKDQVVEFNSLRCRLNKLSDDLRQLKSKSLK